MDNIVINGLYTHRHNYTTTPSNICATKLEFGATSAVLLILEIYRAELTWYTN